MHNILMLSHSAMSRLRIGCKYEQAPEATSGKLSSQ